MVVKAKGDTEPLTGTFYLLRPAAPRPKESSSLSLDARVKQALFRADLSNYRQRRSNHAVDQLFIIEYKNSSQEHKRLSDHTRCT